MSGRKPSAAQMFALVRAARRGGSINWRDRGSSFYGAISDATIRACVSNGWGTAQWQGRGWIGFQISDVGRAVSADEVTKAEAKDRADAERQFAIDDAMPTADDGRETSGEGH